jgi:hypothetical protein
MKAGLLCLSVCREVLAAIINGTQELLDELAKWGVQVSPMRAGLYCTRSSRVVGGPPASGLMSMCFDRSHRRAAKRPMWVIWCVPS